MHITVLQFHRWKEFRPEPKQLKPNVVKNVTCLSHTARVLSSKCPGDLTVDLISKWWCYHHVYSQNIICSLLPGATFTLACTQFKSSSSARMRCCECVLSRFCTAGWKMSSGLYYVRAWKNEVHLKLFFFGCIFMLSYSLLKLSEGPFKHFGGRYPD